MKQFFLSALLLLSGIGARAQNAPSVTVGPSSQSVLLGGRADFSAVVSGTGPFTFKWRHNGATIPLIITTVAGNGNCGSAGDGGRATNAYLDNPNGVAIDGSGNLFIADYVNQRIRKVDTNGVITTVVGNGIPDYTGDGAPATNAAIDSPSSLALDDSGNLFFADLGNNCIRRVGTNGIITTVAGMGMDNSLGGPFSGDGGPATNASLNFAYAIALDSSGNLFIADTGNNRVRKVASNGVINTVAGTGAIGFSGDGGAATNASLNAPLGLCADSRGNLFVADTYNRHIRKINAGGIITSVAGGGPGDGGDGGPATSAGIGKPAGVAVDGVGNLFLVDPAGQRIREVGTDGIISTAAGNGTAGYFGDGGSASNAGLSNPSGVAMDGIGNLFIADRDNNCVRKVSAQGPALRLDNLAATDAGNYEVVVSNPSGTVTSAVVVLTVLLPPEITQQPPSRYVAAGGGATLSVVVAGTGPLNYQWYFNGTALPGQTNETLQFPNANAAIAGDYEVTVTNLYGSVTSRLASLTVGNAPIFSTQPTNQVTIEGGSPMFSVAVSGTGPFSYQWQYNGVAISPMIITVAGNGAPGYSGDGRLATSASLNYPFGIAVDGKGNLLIADYLNNRIRKVDPSGVITTVAGTGAYEYSGDGGAATSAGLSAPQGVAADGVGNLFIADTGTNRIRKVDADGIITTIAGTGMAAYSGDGGQATNASLNQPVDVIPDGSGGLYIADTGNSIIRQLDSSGLINVVAGGYGGPGRSGDGGAATEATLNLPSSLAADNLGNLFIADTIDAVIRKVDTSGIMTTFAGNGVLGFAGNPGTGTNVEFANPNGVVVDEFGGVFVADTSNNRIRKIDPDGTTTTLAGIGPNYPAGGGYSGDGGAGTTASLHYPSAVTTDARGNLFFADSRNNRVRELVAPGPTLKISDASTNSAGGYSVVVTSRFGSVTSSVASLALIPSPNITRQPQNQTVLVGENATLIVTATDALPLNYQWYFDGAILAGQTNDVLQFRSAELSNSGNFYVVVADQYVATTSSVVKLAVGFPPVIAVQPTNQTTLVGADLGFFVTASGTGPLTYQWRFNGTNLPAIITTVAGNGNQGSSGDNGMATNGSLNQPYGLAVDAAGNLFIADYGGNRVRRVDTSGIITTVAGLGTNDYSGDGGPATNAALNNPSAVAVSDSGDLFIADTGNNRIRKVDAQGTITTIAGNGAAGYYGDGGPATSASLFVPFGVAMDQEGNLLIADTDNNRIRKVDAKGLISTVAGVGSAGSSGDSAEATNAMLNNPICMSSGDLGELYIADNGNHVIRKVDGGGIISTFAGTGTAGYSGDGGLAVNAMLNDPRGVIVDSAGNLFIGDTDNNRVREVRFDDTITTAVATGEFGYSGDEGAATNAKLALPSGLVFDGQGNLFVADSFNNRIRKVAAGGPTLTLLNVTTNTAGNYDVVVTSPFGSVTSSIASLLFVFPPSIVQEPQSQMLAVGTNADFSVLATGTVRLNYQWYFGAMPIASQTSGTLALTNVDLTEAGKYRVVVTNLYGTVTSSLAILTVGYPPSITAQPTNQTEGVGGRAEFSVEAAGTGPLTYSWQFNSTNIAPRISTVAGTGTPGYSGDGGTATNAALNQPYGIAVDGSGNLLIADYMNNRIRRVDTNGMITTVAGNGTPGYSGDGDAAMNAELSGPVGVAVDGLGNILMADTGNNVIRKVDAIGNITTIAGTGVAGYSGDGGAATNANLLNPFGVTPDGNGGFYIVDTGNSVIRDVETNGIIVSVAGGDGPNGYSGDGGPAADATLDFPSSIARDGVGSLFIADTGNVVIREVGTDGIIVSVAGRRGVAGYSGDGGPATTASLNSPFAAAVDGLGNLFIADSGNDSIRKVDAAGIITTVAGNGTIGYSGDGGAASNASLNNPSSLAVTDPYHLFIADTDNNVIRKVIFYGATLGLNAVSPGNTGTYDVVVSSPYGGVTSSIVTLTVTLPQLRAVISAGKSLILQLDGGAGQTYVLQAATNLLAPVYWQPVYTNSADAGGNWHFTNSNLPANPAVFYRVTLP